METPPATIEEDGWCLLDAEHHAEKHPGFELPERSRREALVPGDAAKLLFDIEARKNGKIVNRGVDRMWVIVRERTETGYIGVLDSDPGYAENLNLLTGMDVEFGAEHVTNIDRPPREYIEEKYGPDFLTG